jgi:endonuclease YncB( thermonuclease family)
MATHVFRIVLAVVATTALTGCKQDAATAEQAATVEVPQPLTTFYSHATARDGDDLEISVRMNGFDTPERGKVCRNPSATEALPEEVNVWGAARDALNNIVRERRVDCVLVGHDQQDERMVATCSVEGRDIGEQMVEQGWARDWPRYSEGRYAAAEARAREARRGIWGLECRPDIWSNRDYSAPARPQE